ncbi:serine beta-lactamase-like protein LACTB, mitochondrial [Bacillus rossius redtenbacheri]|uniref:serine beta-lactamase-like protein LACTB, mitochondrial n=1 Tax=Bacillus rossius redtenbacheri TaxID=93214 RepID=UPI002FDD61E0
MARNWVIIGAAANVVALSCGIQYENIKNYLKGSECEANVVESRSTKHVLNTSPQLQHDEAIQKSTELVENFRTEIGVPGLVIGVSVNGKPAWLQGFGLSDVENGVKCHAGTVMRIASISKSMTMAVVAKLWEDGRLDLDRPVQHYVPHFPDKTFKGEKVAVTTRQLVSHMAGIRHYSNNTDNNNNNNNNKSNKDKTEKAENKNKEEKPRPTSDSVYKEFLLNRRFSDVKEALTLFKDDELVSKPGSSFLYTTHGWTLISAVVEGVTKEPFPVTMTQFFNVLGLKNTYLDFNERIIYNRARYYTKGKNGRLQNAPCVDVSYKWAGGGFLSSVGDLLRFGNAMLYCSQQAGDSVPGYLRRETVSALWEVHSPSPMHWGRGSSYGMGWVVVPARHEYAWCDDQRLAVGHSGGAVGASSVLVVVPAPESCGAPAGVIVAVLVNLSDVSLHRLAFQVANLFAE